MQDTFDVEDFFGIKPPDKFTRFEKQVLDRLVAMKRIGKTTPETLEETPIRYYWEKSRQKGDPDEPHEFYDDQEGLL